MRAATIAVVTLVAALFALPCGLIFLLVASPSPAPGPGVAAPVPPAVLVADQQASAGAPAGCAVPVALLLAIGEVESGNAARRSISPAGDVSPPIVGPALDGSIPGTEAVADTDGGALDGDPVWDHAVGFLQILPATWRRWATPGADPQNLLDAARTAVAVLCQPARDLTDPPARDAALHAYNPSDTYVASVDSWFGTYEAYDAETAPATAAATQPASSSRNPGSIP